MFRLIVMLSLIQPDHSVRMETQTREFTTMEDCQNAKNLIMYNRDVIDANCFRVGGLSMTHDDE